MAEALFDANTRRGAIARVGLELFYSKGYHATGMREIANRLGMTVASLYNHFDSKPALLEYLLEGIMRALIQQVRDQVDPSAEPEAQLRAAMQAHILFHAHHQRESAISNSELRGLEGAARSRIIALRDEYEEIFRRILSQGVATGHFAPLNPKLAAFGIITMCRGVARWYRPEGAWTLAEVADGYCTLAIEGLRPR